MLPEKIVIDPPYVAYDVENKKAVLVFRTASIGAKYLYGAQYSKKSVYAGKRSNANLFSTPLAIRYAKEEHKRLLGEDDILVLDARFYKSVTFQALKLENGQSYNKVKVRKQF
jgi:hypothetical protein